ncbi:unnamed protein product [Arctia plantaginis]|uniref:Uncharacterized protein n=1 Tax=Arctia plantaginis TaxID=874455 RepID=A0A8S1B1T0_ARCPL|nr:unnamed protein product [Arctia plantaginis]
MRCTGKMPETVCVQNQLSSLAQIGANHRSSNTTLQKTMHNQHPRNPQLLALFPSSPLPFFWVSDSWRSQKVGSPSPREIGVPFPVLSRFIKAGFWERSEIPVQYTMHQ